VDIPDPVKNLEKRVIGDLFLLGHDALDYAQRRFLPEGTTPKKRPSRLASKVPAPASSPISRDPVQKVDQTAGPAPVSTIDAKPTKGANNV